MHALILTLTLTAHAGKAPEPRPVPAHVDHWRDQVDWTEAGDEAVDVLSRYLQVDTVNPPGNEANGVAFLGGILDAEGIRWEAVDHAENRSSLIAWIDGAGEDKPLCLLSHIDVVTSELDKWDADKGPLSGVIEDGQIWGRGALDMKGMGAVELMSLVWLKRLGVPLRRDVILIAVADEEVDNIGMRALVDEHWDRLDCGQMINEGGLAIEGALFEGQTVHAVSVAEKGVLWVRMVAEGRAGHGSTPYPNEAPIRLLQAMEAIDEGYKPKVVINDALFQFLHNIGEEKGGLTGAILKSRFLTKLLVVGKLKANPTTHAVVINTVHLTGMEGAQEPNVVPSEVSALYDCRLRLGVRPDDVLDELKHLTRKVEGISWQVISAKEANESPVDDSLYEAIAAYAVEGREGSHVAGPVLSVGFTDSIYARPKGTHAYGYVPFVVTQEEGETMHGHRERVSVQNVHDGLRVMFSIVVDVAAEPR